MKEQNLTRATLVDSIYEQSNFNRTEAKEIVENLLDIMKTAIKKDNALLFSGFGKFEAYAKKARRGRNPKTCTDMTLPPRRVVVFRVSRKLRSDLNPKEN